jgi:hypothetical protein
MISILETVENSAEMIASLEKKLIGTDSEDIFTESEEEVVLNSERVKLYNFSTEVTHESPVKANIFCIVGPQDTMKMQILRECVQN